jgi:hypothetical protein
MHSTDRYVLCGIKFSHARQRRKSLGSTFYWRERAVSLLSLAKKIVRKKSTQTGKTSQTRQKNFLLKKRRSEKKFLQLCSVDILS